MRLLLSFTLILSIQLAFVSTGTPSEVGIWTVSEVTVEEQQVCCVPNSITFHPTSLPDVLIAQYKYDMVTPARQAKCKLFFGDLAKNLSGNLTVVEHVGTYSTEVYDHFYDLTVLVFQASSSTSAAILTVATPYSEHDNLCRFTMRHKERKKICY